MASEKNVQNQIPCMILCAGTSRRFGSDKMLAHLAGKPLLMHTIENVTPQVSDLALNGEGAGYNGFSLSVFSDVISGKLGPLAGVLTAMEWAKKIGSEQVLTLSGDAPFVPNDWAVKLSATSSEVIAIPNVDGQSHQVCGLWPAALAPVLRSFLQAGDSYKVRDFLAAQKTKMVAFRKQDNIDPFFNVNTPEDMQIAEQVLASRP